jgi:hypothetical protein
MNYIATIYKIHIYSKGRNLPQKLYRNQEKKEEKPKLKGS